jgi:hypothetical protein
MTHTFLRLVRRIHRYFGLLIAPTLLFFAFTGALQMLSLHEGAPGSAYKPPAWLAEMAQLHKNATLQVPQRRAAGPPQADVRARPAAPSVPTTAPLTLAAKQKRHLPMKIFFVFVALGLTVSTLTGVFMAYRFMRRPLVVTTCLLAGIVIPLILLRF